MTLSQRIERRKQAYQRYLELKEILPTIRLIAERMNVAQTYLEYCIRKERGVNESKTI